MIDTTSEKEHHLANILAISFKDIFEYEVNLAIPHMLKFQNTLTAL